MRLTESEWQVAERACTPAQLQALDYWRHGYGYKRIALVLGIPRDAARGRIERALDNIRRSTIKGAA